jgi:hypothetical protein
MMPNRPVSSFMHSMPLDNQAKFVQTACPHVTPTTPKSPTARTLRWSTPNCASLLWHVTHLRDHLLFALSPVVVTTSRKIYILLSPSQHHRPHALLSPRSRQALLAPATGPSITGSFPQAAAIPVAEPEVFSEAPNTQLLAPPWPLTGATPPPATVRAHWHHHEDPADAPHLPIPAHDRY